MLVSVSLLLAPGEPCPSSIHPRSMCVHAKAETRNRQTSNGRERCKEYMKRHKIDKHDRQGKCSRKASKQAKKQTSKKTNKRWCPWGTNVGLDQISITSLCWSMDDTLASKTYVWTGKQACKEAYKANGWHKQAWQAYHLTDQKMGKVCTSNRHHDDAS